jgi:peptide/nickel transport system ATP-binding protein
MAEPPLLEISRLRKVFGRGNRAVIALDGVDLALSKGETLALAGASGSGKTTLARCILRLIEPDAGAIRFAGIEVTALSGERLRRLRPRIQMVFQDPLAALNPRAPIARAVADPLRIHALVPPRQLRAVALALLERVRLPADLADRLPHQLSGGQLQRVAIARAIATKPELIVLDEPVSSLDASVRAEILNLLMDLQDETGVAYLFVSHDLAVMRAVARRIAVMDAGRIVETAPPEALLKAPQAAATRALLAAVPRLTLGTPQEI